MSVQRLHFRFYDVELQIETDSAGYLRQFVQMYARFQCPGPAKGATEIRASFHTQSETTPPYLILDGKMWTLPDRHTLDGYTYGLLLRSVWSHVRSHLTFHAGVVAWQGQGVLLVADSMHGKTTLTLELVRRGFSVLSDEIAALSLSDGMVYPYPRRLSIRPKTLALVPLSNSDQAIEWFGNLAIDAEDLRPGSLGASVPVRHVILLQDAEEAAAGPRRPPENDLVVVLDRMDDPLLQRIRLLEGVESLTVGTEDGRTVLQMQVTRQMLVLPAIEALCEQAGVHVFDYIRRSVRQPAFAQTARLEPLSKSQGILELLRHLQSDHRSALRRDKLDDDVSSLFLTVARLLGHAQCFRLLVGPLAQNADLMCQLLAEEAVVT